MAARLAVCALVLLALALPAAPLAAQGADGIILGTVREARSEQPVRGVRVTLLRPGRRATTDAAGRYTIERVPVGERELRFERAGYRPTTRTVTVVAGRPTVLEVSLEPTVAGVARPAAEPAAGGARGPAVRISAPAAVATWTVDTAALAPTTARTLPLALQGLLPGVVAVQAAGTPGETGVDLTLRTPTSLLLDGEPLLVVDDVIVASGFEGLNTGFGPVSRLADLDPSDVLQVEVLPGPAAAARYGSRGAQGALLVTTRRGAAGPATVSVAARAARTSLPRRLGFFAPPGTPSGLLDREGAVLDGGMAYDARVGLSGGSARTRYYASGVAQIEDGLGVDTDARRLGLRLRLDHDATERLSLQAGANLVDGRLTTYPYGQNGLGSFRSAFVYGTTAASPRPVDLDPLAALSAEDRTQRLSAQLGARWRALPTVTVRATVGYDDATTEGTSLAPVSTVLRSSGARVLDNALAADLAWPLAPGLALGGSLGATFTDYQLESRRVGTVPGELGGAGGTASVLAPDFSVAAVNLFPSLLWRGAFELAGGARLERVSGLDGIAGKVYPAARAAYAVGDEPWFRDAFGGLAQRLVLRGAYGTAGTLPLPGLGEPAAVPRALDVERTREIEFGADLTLFDRRLDLSVTGFDRSTQYLLLPTALGSLLQTQPRNAGTLEGNGIEALARFTLVDRAAWRWRLTGTFLSQYLELEEAVPGANRIAPSPVGGLGVRQRFAPGVIPGQLYGTRPLRDENGALRLDDAGLPLADTTLVPLGSPIPDQIASLVNEVEIGRGVQLRVIVDGAYGQRAVNATRALADVAGTSPEAARRYLPFGDPRRVPDGYFDALAGIGGVYVDDASYTKLREVSLTIRLGELARWARGSGLELLLAGRNLVTWTSYDGIDPEVALATSGVAPGFDDFRYPLPRSVWVGVRAAF